MTWDFWQKNRSLGKLIDTAGGPATGWWSFDVKALVQLWVDKPAANFGLALIPASGSGYKEFISCDYRGKEKYQPKLVYTYTKDTQETVPANFQLHIDRKSGQIKADGTAVADARIYLNSDDGQTFTYVKLVTAFLAVPGFSALPEVEAYPERRFPEV